MSIIKQVILKKLLLMTFGTTLVSFLKEIRKVNFLNEVPRSLYSVDSRIPGSKAVNVGIHVPKLRRFLLPLSSGQTLATRTRKTSVPITYQSTQLQVPENLNHRHLRCANRISRVSACLLLAVSPDTINLHTSRRIYRAR